MIITHNGTILKHDGTILTKITEVPPQPPFDNTYSLDFDGVDDKVQFSSISLGSDYTLSAWAKRLSSANMDLFGSTDSYGYGALFIGNAGIYFQGSAGYYVFSNSSVQSAMSRTDWVNWAFKRNSSLGTIAVYADSVLLQSVVSTKGMDKISTIGASGLPTGSQYVWNGNIDEVSVFNISSINLTDIYNGGAPTDLSLLATPPTHWYRNGDNGSWKSPQWLIPNNENKDKVSNYSLDFDGVNDYIDLGSSSTVADGGQFSLSFWIKGNTQPIGAKYLFSADYYNLHTFWTIQNTELYWRNINNNYKLLSTNLLDGEWHHILIIWNPDGANSTIRCFTDGVNEVNIATDFRYAPGWNGGAYQGGLQYIGNRGGGTFSGFNGSIDEFAVWDNDQSSNVLDIYNGGTPTTISGAVAHYKMGEEANFTSNWLVDNSISPNRALKFDNTYITAPPWSGYQGLLASTTAISSDHITLSTWFKSTDSGNGQGEIFKTSLYNIRVYANRVYLFKAGALYRYWNSSSLFNGSWHNIIIYIPNTTTWDLADAKIYVDGADLGAGTGIGNGTGVSQITNIYGLFRTGGGGGGTMTAEISNWAYWLSDKRDEVSTIYNNGMPGDLSSLSPNVWWKLDSGTVTTDIQVDVIDSSGNNVTGTGPRNAAKTIPALVSSIVNSRPPYSKRSFAFDGINDKVELGSQSLGITGAISVSAWVKIPTTNTGGGGTNIQQLVCEDSAGGAGRNWLLYWRGGSQNIFGCSIFDSLGTSVGASTNSVVPNDNQWHHVMFTYTGDTSTDGLKLFVDGIQRAQATSANGGTRSTTAVVPTIGGLSNTLQWMFEGNIDEVSIFNTDQSTNVSTIYNDGIPNDLTPLSPLHWYRMGEDASFNGTNWTVPDNVGTNTGTSANMTVDALVGEAPNYSGGGISNGMTIEDRVGNAPNSENNALSFNMDLIDRVEDTPPTP